MWMTRVSINNPVFATMVMVALCVLGLFSYARLGVEQMPDCRSPVAFIDVAYPGASPEAVEREVTKPVEEALNSIAGVKRITSRSFEGRSQTSVEFTLNADMAPRDAGRARPHRGRAGGASRKTPRRRRSRASTTTTASRWWSWRCSRPTRSARELSILADQVVGKRLQRVEGVATRRRVGPGHARGAHRPRPAAPARLRRDAGRDRHRAARGQRRPAGRPAVSDSDAGRACCASRAGCATRGSSPTWWWRSRGGLALTLGDLGTLVEREREPDSLARINGQRAINFNVFKQQDANIVATGEAVKAAMDELRKSLPPDVELRLIYANSDWVKGSLTGLQHTLIEGALLTVAIVFLFLHSLAQHHHHRADAADRGDLQLHRRAMPSASR